MTAEGDHPLDMPLHRMSPSGPDDEPPAPRKSVGEVAIEAAMALPHLVKLCARLLRDPRVPRRTKVVLGAAGLYVASPIDLIPEMFFPIVGRVDDLILLAFALHRLLDAVEPEVLEELWDGDGDALELVTAFIAWGGEMMPAPLRRLLER
jgi:uncharacterized membrane protein YkvA (DUF1232 family)